MLEKPVNPIIDLTSDGTNLIAGVAATYFVFPGIDLVSNWLKTNEKLENIVSKDISLPVKVSSTIRKSKHGNGGNYPDFIINMMLDAYRHHFNDKRFDLLLYVPNTVKSELLESLSERISEKLSLRISHELVKTRETQQQKLVTDDKLKAENVKDAFTFLTPGLIKGKSILLIDDVLHSGTTIKEIARYLTELGAKEIAPLVIAMTGR